MYNMGIKKITGSALFLFGAMVIVITIVLGVATTLIAQSGEDKEVKTIDNELSDCYYCNGVEDYKFDSEKKDVPVTEKLNMPLVFKESVYKDSFNKKEKALSEHKVKVEVAKVARLAKLEEIRLAKVEAERLAKIEAERLAQLEKERLAAVELARAVEAEKVKFAGIQAEKDKRQKEQVENKVAVVSRGNQSTAGGWMNFQTTYYTAGCTGCSGITAMGVDVRGSIYHNGMRVIAVDPSRIPLGSIVQVESANGSFKAIAADTGGVIRGNIIDTLVGSKDEARRLGRHAVRVRILK